MELDDSGVRERPTGTAKNPILAMVLASIRILLYSAEVRRETIAGQLPHGQMFG